MEIKLRIIHEKLRQGDALSDEDLKIARKMYRPVVKFLRGINDRRFDLFTDSLNDYLRRMDEWHKARGRKNPITEGKHER